MPAVPRTASTGAPTSDGAAAPDYSDRTQLASPFTLTGARQRIEAARAARAANGQVVSVPTLDGATVTYRARTPSADAVYTGMVAVDRASAYGSNVAAATDTDPALATSVVRQYRQRTGSWPDLSSLGALDTGGNYSTGGTLDNPPIMQAGILGGLTPTTLLVLGAVGLALVLLFGKRR